MARPPAGFEEGKSYPTLLTIHGGPFAQYGTGFFDEVQVYAGAGYAVLFSNPRGGSGHSEAWARAIRGPLDGGGSGWGVVDYEDLMAVVDTALEKFPFLDADRLGVIGGSYGGYMTSWIIGHTKRFKAAVSERAVNSLDEHVRLERHRLGVQAAVRRRDVGRMDTYLAMSPATYAQEIETPRPRPPLRERPPLQHRAGRAALQHAPRDGQGRRDGPLPRREPRALALGGSPVHRVMRFDAILEWFGRYLSPRG